MFCCANCSSQQCGFCVGVAAHSIVSRLCSFVKPTTRWQLSLLCYFPQSQGQRGTDNRPRTPPTFQRDQRQCRPRPATLPGPARQPRQGCFVCGNFGCHTVIHERNGTLPPNFRRVPTSGSNDRSGNNSNNSRLNANARVFMPSPNGQRRSPTGNSGGNPGTGNRVPPLQRPSSA